ncbi:MAG: metallophosphoesterase family protein [Pseudomonadota bacterium]
MKVQDLGELAGEVVLFGGVVSNLQALDALVSEVGDRSAICTGDVVAYCGDPSACVARMRALGWPVVAGNVEQQIGLDADDCGCGFGDGTACDVMSAKWYAHARAALDADARDWAAVCPDRLVFTHHGRRWAVLHGGATSINRFLWPTSPDEVFGAEISALRQQVGAIDGVIAGHSGFPFTRRIDGVEWVNAGSIGMPPHYGCPETHYTILDPHGPVISLLGYDVDAAVAAMQAAGLTQGYDQTLRTGWWPSEDVLPKELRR